MWRRWESNPHRAVRNFQQNRAFTSQPPGMLGNRYPAASPPVPPRSGHSARSCDMRATRRGLPTSRRWPSRAVWLTAAGATLNVQLAPAGGVLCRGCCGRGHRLYRLRGLNRRDNRGANRSGSGMDTRPPSNYGQAVACLGTTFPLRASVAVGARSHTPSRPARALQVLNRLENVAMRFRACIALLLFVSACATSVPSPGKSAAQDPRLANLQRAAALPWTDGGRCAVQEASEPWPVLAERCFHALDHDWIEFHDLTGRCAVASAGAAAVGIGLCVLAAPEIVVGTVIVVGVVVVGFVIKEALDAYALDMGHPEARPAPETRPVPETAPAPQKPSPKKGPSRSPKDRTSLLWSHPRPRSETAAGASPSQCRTTVAVIHCTTSAPTEFRTTVSPAGMCS